MSDISNFIGSCFKASSSSRAKSHVSIQKLILCIFRVNLYRKKRSLWAVNLTGLYKGRFEDGLSVNTEQLFAVLPDNNVNGAVWIKNNAKKIIYITVKKKKTIEKACDFKATVK